MSDAPHPDTTATEPLPKPPKRRLWLTIALGLVIFGSGFAAGAGTTGIVIRSWVLQIIHPPEHGPSVMASLVIRELDLTDAQAAEVRGIFEQRQSELIDIRREVQPRVEAELDLLESEVAEVLNADQQQKWHHRLDRIRRVWMPASR